jgi:hypothetical protein
MGKLLSHSDGPVEQIDHMSHLPELVTNLPSTSTSAYVQNSRWVLVTRCQNGMYYVPWGIVCTQREPEDLVLYIEAFMLFAVL